MLGPQDANGRDGDGRILGAFATWAELALGAHAPLIDLRQASLLALEAVAAALAHATKSAITSDLGCYLAM